MDSVLMVDTRNGRVLSRGGPTGDRIVHNAPIKGALVSTHVCVVPLAAGAGRQRYSPGHGALIFSQDNLQR
jgi:hypothetical protein